MSQESSHYRGRFAPSPSGPLHFGSLIAAVGSYLQARKQRGEWLVRMEDLDLPRCVKGADTIILNTLEFYGLFWDGEVMYQSQRNQAYDTALEQLQSLNACYPCSCTRSEISAIAKQGIEGLIYPGTCRNGLPAGKNGKSIRTRLDDAIISVDDYLQGSISQHLFRDYGDFVIKRGDGLFAYQLAVVVDDAEQAITQIVRGSDLFDSTPRQIWLQKKLAYHTPSYLHLPIATNSDNEKLSKQSYAKAISNKDPRLEIIRALDFLGQQPPEELRASDLNSLWAWAIEHWSLKKIPSHQKISVEDAP